MHNFLFTFPFPEVLNNALKVYGERRQAHRNHILYIVRVCACVCAPLFPAATMDHLTLLGVDRLCVSEGTVCLRSLG